MVREQSDFLDVPGVSDLTYREWHAFIDGVYSGCRWGARSHAYEQEAHYWRMGYLFGTISRYAMVAAVYRELSQREREGETDG